MSADAALLRLLDRLAARGYRFITPTPATHGRVIARPDRQAARTIEDVLGWSLPFGPGVLPDEIEECLRDAGAIRDGRSLFRVSSLGEHLYLHSAYPTEAEDAVFFGPDTYRFADAIERELARRPLGEGARAVDVGTGAGVGAVVTALASPGARVGMTDVNAAALRLARINAAAAGVVVAEVLEEGLRGIDGELDLVTINPPYIADDQDRTYRDGGDMHGGRISLDLSDEAMGRLAPGGRLILYTGSAIVAGEDRLRAALEAAAERHGCTLAYREIDPDVFGEELEKPAYAEVDRIALVIAVATRR